MVRIPIVQILIKYLSHSQSLHLLWQSRHLLNTVIPSSEDLSCFATENILLLPRFKGFLWFFKLPYNTFHLFPDCIKNRLFKTWIHACFNPFSLHLKINMHKSSQKVTKEKDPKSVMQDARTGKML